MRPAIKFAGFLVLLQLLIAPILGIFDETKYYSDEQTELWKSRKSSRSEVQENDNKRETKNEKKKRK